MVKKGEKQKCNKIKLEIGDSEEIRYPSNYFDAVTVAFGSEISKISIKDSQKSKGIKPGGDLIILETAVPKNSFAVLPIIHPFIMRLRVGFF